VSAKLLGAVWFDEARAPADLKAIADLREVKLGFIDLKRRIWHLPETKSQRDHTIHLSAFALGQFEKLGSKLSVARTTYMRLSMGLPKTLATMARSVSRRSASS
jgi:hypothetical protein